MKIKHAELSRDLDLALFRRRQVRAAHELARSIVAGLTAPPADREQLPLAL